MISKQLSAIARNKTIRPNGVCDEILKLRVEAMIPFLARLLDITINTVTITSDWKRAIVVPAYKEEDRSVVTNYRPVSPHWSESKWNIS